MKITLEVEGYPGELLAIRIKKAYRRSVCRRRGHDVGDPARSKFDRVLSESVAWMFFGTLPGRYCQRCYKLDPTDERNQKREAPPTTFSFPRWPLIEGKSDDVARAPVGAEGMSQPGVLRRLAPTEAE